MKAGIETEKADEEKKKINALQSVNITDLSDSIKELHKAITELQEQRR